MRRLSSTDLLVGLLLVSVGVTLRMIFIEIPNFAPVAALALVAGYALKSRAIAVAVPLGVMLISDLMIGAHQPMVMLSVYLMLAAPALLGKPLQRHAQIRSLRTLNTWKAAGLLTASAVTSSCLFFFVTNLACWRFSGWFEQSGAGISSCFVAAVPFFRFTLAGDLAFTIGFFAVYALSYSVARRLSFSATQPATT